MRSHVRQIAFRWWARRSSHPARVPGGEPGRRRRGSRVRAATATVARAVRRRLGPCGSRSMDRRSPWVSPRAIRAPRPWCCGRAWRPSPSTAGGCPTSRSMWCGRSPPTKAFRRVARRGVATAEPGAAHSLHVDATGLEPATAYFFRFRVGDETSPVGRTRTLPASDSSPERVRFIAATCQDYQGHYYRHGGTRRRRMPTSSSSSVTTSMSSPAPRTRRRTHASTWVESR